MNELIKKEQNQITLDPNLVKEAKKLSGEGQGIYMPFIPLLQINNQKKKVKTIVEGVLTDVEIAPEEGFILTTRNKEKKEYEQKFYSKELSAVILKGRYQIKSKYKAKDPFISDEFDSWNEVIKVYDKKTHEIIAEGTYAELKDLFKTGEKDSGGRNKKSFELFSILYLDINGEIFRYKSKMSSLNNWFDYKNSFPENDVYQAYKTNFKLTWSDEGQIKFWYVTLEKGESVDLSKEMALLRELQAALTMFQSPKQKMMSVSQGEIVDDEPTINAEEEVKEETIDVNQIPF